MSDAATEYSSYEMGASAIRVEFMDILDEFNEWEHHIEEPAIEIGDRNIITAMENVAEQSVEVHLAGMAMKDAYDTADSERPGDMNYIMPKVMPYMETFDEARARGKIDVDLYKVE